MQINGNDMSLRNRIVNFLIDYEDLVLITSLYPVKKRKIPELIYRHELYSSYKC